MQRLLVDLLEVEWSRCQARLSGPVRRRHRRRCYSYSYHWFGCAGGITVLPPGCGLLDTHRIRPPRPRFLCGAWTAIHHHTVDVRALEASHWLVPGPLVSCRCGVLRPPLRGMRSASIVVT